VSVQRDKAAPPPLSLYGCAQDEIEWESGRARRWCFGECASNHKIKAMAGLGEVVLKTCMPRFYKCKTYRLSFPLS